MLKCFGVLLPPEHRFVESVVKGRGSNPHIQVPRHGRAGGTESTRRTHSSERLAWAGGFAGTESLGKTAQSWRPVERGVGCFCSCEPTGGLFSGLRKDSEEDFGLGIIG